MADERRQGRALIEVTPEMMERLRDPRTLLGLALIAAGAVAIVIGYFGVSGTLDPGKQLPYIISGGIGGVFLLGCGAALIFSGDLAEARRQLEQMHSRFDDLQEQLALLVEQSAPTAGPTPSMPAASKNGTNGSAPTKPAPRRRAARATTTTTTTTTSDDSTVEDA